MTRVVRTMKIRWSLLAMTAMTVLTPAIGYAQSDGLSFLLVNLIQSEIQLAPPPAGLNHEAHFVPGLDQSLVPYLFNQQVVSQVATFPIGSPTGGFAFTFDAASGTFERTTNSFGPAFADRALTNGRGRLTVGANFQYSKYNSFAGKKLDSGDIVFNLAHEDVAGDQFFEGDVVRAALKLDLSSATSTVFASYGVTDTLDVAIAVPFVRVKLDATVDATILRLATAAFPTIHEFPGGRSNRSISESGEASGLGDVLLRAKYRLVTGAGGGLAAGVDVRLPTGDDKNLLGAGATSATFTVIGSSTRGAFGPHVNFAYTAVGESEITALPNEFSYKVGTELIAAPTVTLSADLIGRSLIDAGRLELSDVTRRFRNVNGVAGSQTFQEFVHQSGSLNLVNLALGGKFNLGGNFLLNANVLVALNKAGLTAKFVPVVGFDYTF